MVSAVTIQEHGMSFEDLRAAIVSAGYKLRCPVQAILGVRKVVLGAARPRAILLDACCARTRVPGRSMNGPRKATSSG
jgi:hypothetical protein